MSAEFVNLVRECVKHYEKEFLRGYDEALYLYSEGCADENGLQCLNCHSYAIGKCTRCLKARYCSVACQRKHFKIHKNDCKVCFKDNSRFSVTQEMLSLIPQRIHNTMILASLLTACEGMMLATVLSNGPCEDPTTPKNKQNKDLIPDSVMYRLQPRWVVHAIIGLAYKLLPEEMSKVNRNAPINEMCHVDVLITIIEKFMSRENSKLKNNTILADELAHKIASSPQHNSEFHVETSGVVL